MVILMWIPSSTSYIYIFIIILYLFLSGWFAKDPNTLHRVGHILLQLPYIEVRQPRHIIIADDCFEYLKTTNQITQIVSKSTEKIFGSMF